MKTKIYPTTLEMAQAAAACAAQALKNAIAEKGQAVFIAATGASQFDFLTVLTGDPEIDWSKTVMFHLDEYIGLPADHPASFRRYLTERIIQRVHPGQVYLIQGDAPDPLQECERLGKLLTDTPADLAMVGIGENGHLAFNDPPADFATEQPYIIVTLDEACRRQQLGEGWFSSLDAVPRQAISMSIQQILKAKTIVCTVPEKRKAQAVFKTINQPVSPLVPATALRLHGDTCLFLDQESASLL